MAATVRTREAGTAASEIDAYIHRKNPHLEDVAQTLRATVKKVVPTSMETVNPWGIPTFESNGPFCYFMVGKNHVTLGFLRGTSLKDPEGLLEGTGKNLRHIKVRSAKDIGAKGLIELIRSASRLNRDGLQRGMRPSRQGRAARTK
jgi:hypothetical protein